MFLKVSLILISTVIFSSCAIGGKKPLQDKTEKAEMGFGFMPPQSDNWFLTTPKGMLGAAYGKKVPGLDLKNKEHSVIFAVQYGTIKTGLSRPEEILNFVRMQKENQLQGLRFDVKKDKSRFTTYRGAKCLEFDSVALDKRVNQNMTLSGMFCLHPEDHRRFVDISYSQRHDLDRDSLDLENEGEEFVKSVKFLPIPPKGKTAVRGVP